MNVVTLPMTVLAAGYAPDLCTRHGQPAASRWTFHGGMVRNWPLCRECVRTRRMMIPFAVACVAVPIIAAIVATILIGDDPVATATFIDVFWVFVLAGPLACWVIVSRTTPAALARAKVTDSNMFLVIQGAHPAFAAHAAHLLRLAEQATPFLPTQEPTFPTAEGHL